MVSHASSRRSSPQTSTLTASFCVFILASIIAFYYTGGTTPDVPTEDHYEASNVDNQTHQTVASSTLFETPPSPVTLFATLVAIHISFAILVVCVLATLFGQPKTKHTSVIARVFAVIFLGVLAVFVKGAVDYASHQPNNQPQHSPLPMLWPSSFQYGPGSPV